MGTNCAPLLTHLFVNEYEAEFIQELLKTYKKHLTQKFNFTFRYKNYVLCLNNSIISEFIDLLFPCELDFDFVNFPFQDGDVPRSTSFGVYISQLIRFARASSHVYDFKTLMTLIKKVLTAKLLRQGYRYHKFRKEFSKFYRRHFDLISKYNVGLKTLLLQGLSEPEF